MTTLTSPSTEQLKRQVDVLLHSSAFASSETLRKLLAFLARHSIEGHSDSLKVREIAVAVFGRSEDFDSQSDSVVRVHTGRLRSKLAEYYMEDGAEDEVIITIPKGGYVLTCHFRHGNGQRPADLLVQHGDMAEQVVLPSKPPDTLSAQQSPPARSRRMVPLTFLIGSVLAAVALTWTGLSYATALRERAKVSPALRTFWQDFASPSQRSLLVFSNFRFLNLGNEAGLVTYNGPDDPQKPIIDTYTTMGEVMGVYAVSHTLHLLGAEPVAKRSRLLTWDEAKDSNLVFVGGPIAETPLRDIPLLQTFQFTSESLKDGRHVGAIVNLHPGPGEDSIYFASDSIYSHADVHTSKLDYAVVAFRPSFQAGHHVLILAGISEYGTEGASEFSTNDAGVRELLAKLKVSFGQAMPPFEALLRVRIEGGVPVESDLVTVHQNRR